MFLMVIQIFTEKHFSTNFWTAVALKMVDPSFFSFWDIYILINILVANKYTKYIKWGWMGLDDATWRVFPEIDETLLAKISHERWSNAKIFENNNIIAFQWGVIHPNRRSSIIPLFTPNLQNFHFEMAEKIELPSWKIRGIWTSSQTFGKCTCWKYLLLF